MKSQPVMAGLMLALFASFLLAADKPTREDRMVEKYKIKRSTDKFAPNYTKIEGQMIQLTGEEYGNGVQMMPMFLWNDLVKSGSYCCYVYYTGKDWAFLNSVTFLIDGKLDTYTDEKPYQNVGSGYVFETITFKPRDDFWIALADIDSISMRVRGKNDQIDVELAGLAQRYLVKFWHEAEAFKIEAASRTIKIE